MDVFTDIIDSNTAGYMSWSQIKQFIEDGGSIGQHTSTHLHMPLNSKKYVKEDLLNSHKSFMKNIGFVPKLFAYPYGETSLAIIELLKELNINHAFFTLLLENLRIFTAELISFLLISFIIKFSF